jgi:hypothetical protein
MHLQLCFFAVLFCFKGVASLCPDDMSKLGVVLDEPGLGDEINAYDQRSLLTTGPKAPTRLPPKAPTKAPIVACGKSSNAITAYINAITQSKKKLSPSGTNPLDKALKYLIASNKNVGVQLSTCLADHKARLRNRFAYLALMYSTGNEGRETTWFGSSNECEWAGIVCNGNTVRELVLTNVGLQGTIPADVGLWSSLNKFDVSYNQLGGSLPSSIGKWTVLNYFSVESNELTGTIPKEVAKWTSFGSTTIGTAFFHYNMFTGAMPTIGYNWCPSQSLEIFQYLIADCKAEIFCRCCNLCK